MIFVGLEVRELSSLRRRGRRAIRRRDDRNSDLQSHRILP